MNNRAIIPVCVFAKPATAGAVKTRLIGALGAEGAAELARAMLRDVWQTVQRCPGVRPILATTAAGDFPMGVDSSAVWLQGDGDLGERIERICQRGLAQASSVMALGADSPAINAGHLEAALAALQTNDSVVGATADGGFYLLGLRKIQAGLLSSLPWSSSTTLQALKERLAICKFSLAELGTLFDVDTPHDLVALDDYLDEHPEAAMATRACRRRNRTPASHAS